MVGWLSPARWLMLIGAALAVFFAYQAWESRQQSIGEERANLRWGKALADQKSKAAGKLSAETAKVLAVERELNEIRQAREKQDATNQSTIAGLRDRLRAAAGPGIRLRDPNAEPAGCRDGGGGPKGQPSAIAEPGRKDPTEAGGLLSAELTGLLQRLTEEADTVNAAYIACREDAIAMRRATP